MNTCEAYRAMDKETTFYNFPQEEEHLQQWINNMGQAEGRTPSESSAYSSQGSDAIPMFSPAEPMDAHNSKEPGNPTNDQGSPDGALDTQGSKCDCKKRLHAIEKSYKLKLVTAQLQIKKCQKELAEQTHKAMKWQRKVIILQSAVKALKQNRSMSSADKCGPSEK